MSEKPSQFAKKDEAAAQLSTEQLAAQNNTTPPKAKTESKVTSEASWKMTPEQMAAEIERLRAEERTNYAKKQDAKVVPQNPESSSRTRSNTISGQADPKNYRPLSGGDRFPGLGGPQTHPDRLPDEQTRRAELSTIGSIKK